MIPGANVLNMALSVIAKQSITYFRATGRSLNNVGQDVTTYASPTIILGSFQPVPKRLYQAYGLDLQKTYFTFYASADLIDIQRDVSGDQIAFNGLRYQCESSNDWFNIDGWKGVLCVLITNPTDLEQPVIGFNQTPSINANLNFDNGNFEVES